MADRPPHVPTDRPVRTRIAPSPTGDPHVGTAYMGLVNTVLARQHGGQFLLRIDDTDRARYRAGSEEAIFAALRWLGLEWDEGPDKGGPCGPYRQSERTAIYREHAQRLLDARKAYRCFCTEERLAALVKEQKAQKKDKLGYDGLCAGLAPDEAADRAKREPFVVRLRVPAEGETTLVDLLRGPIVTKNSILQDQVLLKADGFPTYHLASCVDDHLMRITHIIRAEEWISSGPIHMLIFQAFGWEPPVFCHMPLLRNADKSKISKRKNPTSLLYYKEAGFLPTGLLNFLGLMGWSGPKKDGQQQEIFSLEEMKTHFRLEDIALGGPVFDIEKLRHINAQHMRALSPERYHEQLKAWLFDDRKLKAIETLVQGRAETFGGFMAYADFFFGDVCQQADLLVPKKKTPEEQAAAVEDTWYVIGEVMGALDKVEGWKTAEIEAAIRALASDEPGGWKAKDLFMTVRVAMTGKTNTPPLCESMEILGKSRCLGRLGEAMRALPEPSKKAQERREKAKREKDKGKEGGPGGAPGPGAAPAAT